MALSKDIEPSNGTNIGFESECWKMADKLHNTMDVAEYKHVVLGRIGMGDTEEPQGAWL